MKANLRKAALYGLIPVAITIMSLVAQAAGPQEKPKPSAKPSVAKPEHSEHSTGGSRGPSGGGQTFGSHSNTSNPVGGATHSNTTPVGGATHSNTTPVGGATHSNNPTNTGGSRGPVGGSNMNSNTGHGSSTVGGGSRGPMNSGNNAVHGSTTMVSHGPSNSGMHTPPGGRTFGGHAGSATFDHGGRPREIHTAGGMDIHHGPGGMRTAVVERPGGVRVVTYGRGYGYVQHPYAFHNVSYVSRTYYVNGRMYNHFYRPFLWGGVSLHVYAPGFFFGPAFYGWAYNPWAAPVVYAGWGWGGTPWYGYYGPWFSPYPRYLGPSFWLTDYLVSQTLMAAYMEQQAANAAYYNQPLAYQAPLSPEVKDMIAAEVQRQIALENSEAAAGVQSTPDPASSGIARMLSDGQQHVFVVANSVDVTSNAGGECFLTEGDVLQLRGTVPPGQPANLTVLASKGQDCMKGSTVQVQVADLQEMQNHMRETIDQGLSDLQKKQGQGGLPPAPVAATAPPQQTGFAAIAPPPDPNVQTELKQQSQEADQAEKEVLQEAGYGGPGDSGMATPPPPGNNVPPPAPATRKVTMGMSVDEVVASWGQPKDIVDLGNKKIYVYDSMKFTFTNGKLTSAQ